MIEDYVPDKFVGDDFVCEEHNIGLIKDYHGNSVCVVCIVEDRLNLPSNPYELLLDDEDKLVYYNSKSDKTVIDWKDSDVVETFPGRVEDRLC